VVEKAGAYPTDSRFLQIAKYQLVKSAKHFRIRFKQTFAKECKQLKRNAAGYAYAKQFRRLKRRLKRWQTTVGIVIREIQR